MFEPCVLGVDPGVAATGIAAVGHRGRHAELLWADTIRTPSNLPEASRLRYIHDHVRQAIAAYRPSSVAIEEYGPLEVKMAVTGSGMAKKAQVREALARLHGLAEVPAQPDAADAVAIALCHLTQTPLRRAARAAGLRGSPSSR